MPDKSLGGAGSNNTTVLPRTPLDQRPASQGPATPAPQGGSAASQVTLVALLTQDGQRIDQGLVWRVFADGKEGPEAKKRLVATSREASPVVRLPPGDYWVNAAFGRAHLTRRITIKPGVQSVEPFTLNAGGLRVTVIVGNREIAPANTVSYDIYSDERDQAGNRTKILGGAKPGVIMRLNSGIYHIVSTYGDANSVLRVDVTVEAGKLTDAKFAHAAGKVTFKLVTRAGGEALPGTQWSVLDPQGDVVKESVGALPTHTLAPGRYIVSAKSGGRLYRREFNVQHGENTQVEVVAQ